MEKKLQLKKRTILVLNEEQTSEVAGGEIPNPRPTYDNADRCIGGTEGYCPPTEPPADLCPSDPGQSCDCGGRVRRSRVPPHAPQPAMAIPVLAPVHGVASTPATTMVADGVEPPSNRRPVAGGIPTQRATPGSFRRCARRAMASRSRMTESVGRR